MNSHRTLYFVRASFFLFLIFSIGFIFGCSDESKIVFDTEYQAVLLDDGQAFYGKLANADSTYPLLTDVFYIQRMVNKETNEVTNSLIKRGNEWHGPDRMYINAGHIMLIEPISPDSKVAQFIKETKAQEPNARKQ